MIAFGTAITDSALYERCAEPGIKLAAEPDSLILPYASTGSIFRNYNMMFDLAAAHEELEALVLVHQDAEIVDPEFCSKLRATLADPMVGLVGCVGGINVRNIAWWEGSTTWASFTHSYPEFGGGDFPAFSWDEDNLPAYAHTGEVDVVDGFVMAFSPWVVRNLRFDESLGVLHGYDFDFALQVREAGHKVATSGFRVIHHHSLDLIGEPESWIEAHIRLAEKWHERMPGVGDGGGDWRQRARRAEARSALLRNQMAGTELKGQAEVRLLERLVSAQNDTISSMEESVSWRLTAPIRWLKRLFRGRKD